MSHRSKEEHGRKQFMRESRSFGKTEIDGEAKHV
jgi:hypothetical protein